MKLKTKFQDENFELGEVVESIISLDIHDKIEVTTLKCSGGTAIYKYNSVKDFTDHWEDAPEEPKQVYFIDECGYVNWTDKDSEDDSFWEEYKRIGNYFETKEEAEAALAKLKAWQRLKKDLVSLDWQPEHGGKFSVWGEFRSGGLLKDDVILQNRREDLDILFGGEE